MEQLLAKERGPNVVCNFFFYVVRYVVNMRSKVRCGIAPGQGTGAECCLSWIQSSRFAQMSANAVS